MKNNLILTIVIALLVGVASFYSGMQYQKNQRNTFSRQQIPGRNQNGQGNFQGRGNNQGMAPVRGEIISQDDKSITVKMQDGSSKIVILSGTTTINKATEVSKADLTTGGQVVAFGTSNSDGSITAQSVSIGGGMFGGMRNGQPNQLSPTATP